MSDEWRCFHCGEVFTDSAAAALHFGTDQSSTPACRVDAAELRLMEAELASYRNEDTELHREIGRLTAEIETQKQRAEEAGYARGLDDAKKHPETLGLARVFQTVGDARTREQYAADKLELPKNIGFAWLEKIGFREELAGSFQYSRLYVWGVIELHAVACAGPKLWEFTLRIGDRLVFSDVSPLEVLLLKSLMLRNSRAEAGDYGESVLKAAYRVWYRTLGAGNGPTINLEMAAAMGHESYNDFTEWLLTIGLSESNHWDDLQGWFDCWVSAWRAAKVAQ